MPQNSNTPVVLNLQTPAVVQQAVSVNTLTIERIVDLPSQKIVRAFVREVPQPIVLWSGADYDAAGDWTQAQANAQIIAKVQAGLPSNR